MQGGMMKNLQGFENMVSNFLKRVWLIFTNILQAIFKPEDEKSHPWLPYLWLGALILAGAILWGIFFHWGNVPFNYMDWAEVWAARLQAWRDALVHNTLPFHLSDLAAMRSTGDRYFAVADMVSSPQVVLLRWLDVGTYSLVNNLILYGIASYYLLVIRKKYNLSLFAFAFLFLLFQFNGYIVAHLSIGHLSWGGYYLFPAFVLFLLELLEGNHSWGWVTKMAVLLFFMFMQGSFHHLVWCFIVLGIMAVIRWRHFFQIFKAVLFTILLSMWRVIPAFWGKFSAPSQGIDFLGGFPNLFNILKAMIYNSTPDMALPMQVFNSNLGYWEFDIFIGVVGTFIILGFGLFSLAYWQYKQREFPYLLVPAAALTFLSIDDNFLKVLFYNPALVSSERVASRMIGLALVILIILAAIYYQKSLNRIKQNFVVHVTQLALLFVLIIELVLHTLRWSVKNASFTFGVEFRDLSGIHVSNHADPQYFSMLGIGLLVTILSTAFLVWVNRKKSLKNAANSSN